MTSQNSPTPILPGGPDDEARRSHSRQRLRLMTGTWEQDIEEHRKRHFEGVRNLHIGPSDMSTNFLYAICTELAKLHETPTMVSHDTDVTPYLDQITAGGWWQMAQLMERRCLAMNEMLVRPHWSPDTGYMFRLVNPSDVWAKAHPDTPDTPYALVEARPRKIRGKSGVLTWDYANADDRVFQVLLPHKSGEIDKAEDITSEVMGEETDLSGDRYPFIASDGIAECPYIVYHSERTGHLFDAWRGMEMVDGTLTVAVLWTFWTHVVRDASWPQRYVVGAALRGTSVTGTGADAGRSVPTDPASILQFRADGDGAANVGQWQPGADPAILGQSIQSWEQRLGVYYHLGSDDFQRGGSAESGYAIALKRQSVREACRHYEPQFRRGDQQLLRLCAIMQNRATGTNAIPEDGYRVSYPSLPKSIEERKAESEEIDARIARGTASSVDAYILDHPGTTRDEAMKKLIEIQEESRQLAAGMPRPPVSPNSGFGG